MVDRALGEVSASTLQLLDFSLLTLPCCLGHFTGEQVAGAPGLQLPFSIAWAPCS